MKKRFICIILTIVITLFVFQNSFTAYENIDNESNYALGTDAELLKKVALLTKATIKAEGANIKVSSARVLYDFSKNKYTLVECKPTGYFILHNKSGQYIEYSTEAQSPYLNVSNALIYGGPTYYYTIKNCKIVSTIDDTVINFTQNTAEYNEILQYCDDMDAAIMECANEKIASFLADDTLGLDTFQTDILADNDINVLSDEIISNQIIPTLCTKKTDYWVTSSDFFSKYRVTNFGYYCPKGSNGICGYIAANLVLQYWEYRNKISFKDDYTSENSRKDAKLTIKLYEIGKSLGYSDGTWGYEIAKTMNTFCKNNSLSQNASWTVGCLGIVNEIKNNKRPCILFGSLPYARGGHAVVVYGYNTYEHKNFYTFVCHYGWNKQGYTKVHIFGGLYGSNVKYHP
ncbi:MAG: hypothetical protein HDT44_03410 [Ruminococcaceae bacterium]|nr:hypothetical protein [Oscillospiraceae bacterium]